MSTMPVSQRQMAEIAKAVSFNSKIIVFDEPTSSLTEEEVEHLFKIINMLRDQGCGIIYISHKMAEILRISDDITVMRDGTWVATKPAKEMTMDEIEAALDEANVSRYANYLHKLTKNTQFIIITHRRGTMAAADRLYGITMQEKGISALVSVNLIEEALDQ